MKKLLLSATLVALTLATAFGQTNAITAGNGPTTDNKGYVYNFDGGTVDNCLSSNGVAYFPPTQQTWTIPGNGFLKITVPTQTVYNGDVQQAAFYSGNCVSKTIDLSSNANKKFSIKINSSPANTSTTTSRQLVVVFYQGSNSNYSVTSNFYTVTTGSNIIFSTISGFGITMDSTKISGIGLLFRGTGGYLDFDAAGTYTIDNILVGTAATVAGTSTTTTPSTSTSTGFAEDEYYASQVSVFPNPATENVTIDLSSVANSATVKLVNMSGAVVAEQTSFGTTTFPVSGLTKGLYFIQISTEARVIRKKVMIE